MPKGDLAGWHHVFADNFAGESVPLGAFSGCTWPSGATVLQLDCSGLAPYPMVRAKWFAYPDGWADTSHNGTYYPSRVVMIRNGVMSLHVHTESVNGTTYHMVAAPMPKIPGGEGPGGGLLYGRYDVRFRAAALHGYKTAWLLWPDSNVWPQNGEIDFPEGNLDSTFSAFLHWMNGTSATSQYAYPTPYSYSAWHTATVEWTPASCRFMVDGAVVGTARNYIPSTPMHWVLQTETSYDGTIPSNSTSGDVQIDWVTAYVPS